MFIHYRFNTFEEAEEIEDFFLSNPLSTSIRTIQQKIEQIRSNAKFLEFLKTSVLVTDPNIWD